MKNLCTARDGYGDDCGWPRVNGINYCPRCAQRVLQATRASMLEHERAAADAYEQVQRLEEALEAHEWTTKKP